MTINVSISIDRADQLVLHTYPDRGPILTTYDIDGWAFVIDRADDPVAVANRLLELVQEFVRETERVYAARAASAAGVTS